MYFTKYPHPANFRFANLIERDGLMRIGERVLKFEHRTYEDEVHHVRIAGPWPVGPRLAPLDPPNEARGECVEIKADAGLSVKSGSGKEIMVGQSGNFFGISGDASLFQLALPPDARFYGMGEKTFGRIELSGIRTRFWNTDVWADFHEAQWTDRPTDPPYFSTPYVVCRIGGEYVGLLLDNAHPTWMSTPGKDETRVFVEWQRTDARLVLGSEGGEPNLWIICGPTLQEVTRKLQSLVGRTPLPPLWALGYHQSRWGYGGEEDLLALDDGFAKHQIPCDGLWLDLDYMRGFRIFETSREMFPNGVRSVADTLSKNGRRIVPIIDPGVKKESGYRVYDDGMAQDVFCRNAEGEPFVGLVWPGETAFPDFTLPEARDWWAGYAAGFLKEGYGGTWLDMNDPSTGPVDPNGMLFKRGTESHAAHHNEYALGMQMATRAGFLQARPDERPFILSRSGFTGSSRYSAIWTGDNVSNRFYLQCGIPASLNLSLSGLPFNGPDMGGFGGNATDELFSDWVKAGFLFPFFRNHAVKGSRPQEPWAFRPGTIRVAAHYIRLRYKLLPYLYNLFADQEELGDPILRPLFYHYDDEGLDGIDDEFMVGPFVLQAPHVGSDALRNVVLPGKEPWFEASNGHWVSPAVHHRARTAATSPLFFANGAIVPMRPGIPKDSRTDLRRVEFHVFADPSHPGRNEILYRADDGLSFGYQRGERTELRIAAEWSAQGLQVECRHVADGFGRIKPKFVIHGKHKQVAYNGRAVRPSSVRVRLTGPAFAAMKVTTS